MPYRSLTAPAANLADPADRSALVPPSPADAPGPGAFSRRGWGLALPDSLAERAVLYCLLFAIVIGLAFAYNTADAVNDFQAFVDSGMAAVAGLDPYGAYTITWIAPFPNLNPPVSVLLFQPLAYLPLLPAMRAWQLVCAVLYAVFVALALRGTPEHRRLFYVGWLLSLAGLWNTVESKNIYVVLALIGLGAWSCLRRGRVLGAGVLIGLLVAIKPNFLVWPVLLLLAGHAGVAATALAVAGGLSVLPALVYGPGIYAQWLTAVQLYSFPVMWHNASLSGLAVRWGLFWTGSIASGALLAGSVASGVLLLFLAIRVWRRRPSPLEVSGLALVSALLAAPIAWIGYSLLLVPVFLGRPWTPPLRAAAVLLVLPLPLAAMLAARSPLLLAVVGSAYSCALLLVLVALMRTADEPVASAAHSSSRPKTAAAMQLRQRDSSITTSGGAWCAAGRAGRRPYRLCG